MTELFSKIRRSLAGDCHKPLYHFSPPGKGLHDPAGLCWWRGRYHLFYLSNPEGASWQRGHAVSKDLVHWRDLPMLPAQINGGTGQVRVEKNRAIMGYATHGHAAVSMATASDPLLVNWTEHPDNPVAKPGSDNFLWHENGFYYLTYNKYGHKKTALKVLRSRSLTKWKSFGFLFEDGYFTEPGTDCACNNILPIAGGKRLLLSFSHNQGPKYYIGTFDSKKVRFAIENHGRMNYGPVARGSLHAPSGFVAPDRRCIAMWNIMECLAQDDHMGIRGGIISLPRQLSLNNDASNILHPLHIEPIRELKKLRFDPVKVRNVAVPANSEKILRGVKGRAMELDAVIDPGNAREVGLRILRSPDGTEQTTVSLLMHAWAWPWRSDKRELMIDVSQASLGSKAASRSPEVGPLFLKDGELLRLRIFVDRSVVEAFANGRQCLTLRAYPTRQDSTGVSVFARGGKARLVALNAYQMKSIWPELESQAGH